MTAAVAWFGLILLLVGPAGWLLAMGASWRWFALGVLSWGLALAKDSALGAPLQP